MASFHCQGWLSIIVSDGDSSASIKINHDDAHVPYWSIDIPSDVKEYIHKNPELTANQALPIFGSH
jgi:hypothetical protein